MDTFFLLLFFLKVNSQWCKIKYDTLEVSGWSVPKVYYNINSMERPSTFKDRFIIVDIQSNEYAHIRLSATDPINPSTSNPTWELVFDNGYNFITGFYNDVIIRKRYGNDNFNWDFLTEADGYDISFTKNTTFWISWNEIGNFVEIGTGTNIQQNTRIVGYITDQWNITVNNIAFFSWDNRAIFYIYTNCTTNNPTNNPTKIPTMNTKYPTNIPTLIPTKIPTTGIPTINTIQPSLIPTNIPSITPTNQPTMEPTIIPTKIPTINTIQPTILPTSINPTNYPSIIPSIIPTNNPTIIPTIYPSNIPTILPTLNPTTIYPTNLPTIIPTNNPTNIPLIFTTNNILFQTKPHHINGILLFLIIFIGLITLVLCIIAIFVFKRFIYSKYLINIHTQKKIMKSIQTKSSTVLSKSIELESITSTDSGNGNNSVNKHFIKNQLNNESIKTENIDKIGEKKIEYQERALANISYYIDQTHSEVPRSTITEEDGYGIDSKNTSLKNGSGIGSIQHVKANTLTNGYSYVE